MNESSNWPGILGERQKPTAKRLGSRAFLFDQVASVLQVNGNSDLVPAVINRGNPAGALAISRAGKANQDCQSEIHLRGGNFNGGGHGGGGGFVFHGKKKLALAEKGSSSAAKPGQPTGANLLLGKQGAKLRGAFPSGEGGMGRGGGRFVIHGEQTLGGQVAKCKAFNAK
jgi:hypothetical protein